MAYKKVNVGLIGCGTVGQGVLKMLKRNRRAIEHRVAATVEMPAAADIKALPPYVKYFTRDYRELLQRPELDIIVELIGGYEPARTIILNALKAGKHVVTANKAVLAKYWDEIFTTAQKYKKLVYFEAAVAGAIPVVQALNEGLAANHIEKISGILNGTTNYVLSEMTRSRVSFKVALNLARSAGYAEADPSFDIKGIDTAHKLSILSSLAWSSWIRISEISTEGIENVSEDDIYFIQKEFGYVIKLLGTARMSKGKLDISVEPCLVSKKSHFSNVDREYNAVSIQADSAGDVVLYGKGAGQLPAASAVVSDIIFLARQVANGTAGQIPYVSYSANKKIEIIAPEEKEGSYYLRFTSVDKPGALSKIAGILGKHGVSIASCYQKEPLPRFKKGVPVLIVTHRTKRGNLMKAVAQIDNLSLIVEKTVKFRIEE